MANGLVSQDTTIAAMQLSYRLTPRLDLRATSQVSVRQDSGVDNNDLNTIGATWRFGRRGNFDAEYSSGHRGSAATLSMDYEMNASHRVFGTVTHSTDRTNAVLDEQITLGHRSRLSDQTQVFNETQFSRNQDGAGITHVFGLDFAPAPGWGLGLSLQHGELDARTGPVDRDAASASLDYRNDDLMLRSRLEYRRDEGAEDRTQWLASNRFDYKIDDDWRVLARANYSVTDDARDPQADARFIESSIGAAYRPVDNNRFNMLGKLTYLYDTESLGQGEDTDQRSLVGAVEGLYNFSARWQLGGKFALRRSELRERRGAGTWFESNARFAAIRGRYYLARNWDGVVEYRWLGVQEADSTRTGWLIGLDRHLGEHFKLGVGYSFADFSDDLTNLDYTHRGWFINALGKM